MVVCKQAVCRSSLLWWGYTESSIILCSACQHASLTVLVLFRYSCHISHVPSLGPIQGKKKKTSIYIRRIMCFEKPCDIRIWLVCTNCCDSNIIIGAHSHRHIYLFIYCTLWCQQHSIPPWQEAFLDGVGYFSLSVHSLHRYEPSSADKALICAVNY